MLSSPTKWSLNALRRLTERLHPDMGEVGGQVGHAYILALSLIACSFVGAYALATWSIGAQRDAARMIVDASRQEVTANRIAGLSRLLASPGRAATAERDRDRRRLVESIDALEANHARLLATAHTRQERAVYGREPVALDATVRTFVADARNNLQRPDAETLSRMSNFVRGDMTRGFVAIVDMKEDHAQAVDARTHLHHTILLAVSLALLLLEARFIFMPLLRRLERMERRLTLRQNQLAHESKHDQLTGLPNRRALREYVDNQMSVHADGLRRCVVAMDLDNFKMVNDLHGHAAGDRLLLVVADALREGIRDVDRAFRIGGDEFVVIVNEVRQGTDWSKGMLQATDRMASHVRRAISRDPAFSGVSASFGYREIRDPAETFDTVLADADVALYHAKTSGKDRVVRFTSALAHQQNRLMQTEALIRDALLRNAFEPFFQPQIDIDTGQTVALEVLARARSKAGQVIETEAFLDFAVESGLIVAVGEQVAAKAIAAAAGWSAAGGFNGSLALNASLPQLRDPGFVAFLRKILKRHDFAPDRLVIELPDGVLTDETAAATLPKLRKLGVALELDDFGPGLVSVTRLIEAGVTRLKVHREVMSPRDGGPDLLPRIVAFATSMGIQALAEGVETEAQMNRARDAGCLRAQGYHFGRPLDAARTGRLLGSGRLPVCPPPLAPEQATTRELVR